MSHLQYTFKPGINDACGEVAEWEKRKYLFVAGSGHFANSISLFQTINPCARHPCTIPHRRRLRSRNLSEFNKRVNGGPITSYRIL